MPTDKSASAMFQFRHPGQQPTVPEIARHYDLEPDQIDSAYGVVPTDSLDHLYVVLVASTGFDRLRRRLRELGLEGDPAIGLFADPPVETFDC